MMRSLALPLLWRRSGLGPALRRRMWGPPGSPIADWSVPAPSDGSWPRSGRLEAHPIAPHRRGWLAASRDYNVLMALGLVPLGY